MNIVFVKHGESKEYAFRVSDELAPYIKKGDTVAVKTMRGLDSGITTTGVIYGDGAKDVAINKGAYDPIKPVLGVVPDTLINCIRNEMLSDIKAYYSK